MDRAAAAVFALQDAVDAASPGDTVWIEPGEYARTITVHKAITLRPLGGPGSVRLGSLDASLATLEDIFFDGALSGWTGTLATAGSSATFEGCRFTGKLRGVEVASGAEEVLLRDCVFDGLFQAVTLAPGIGSLRLERVEVSGVSLGVTASDSLACAPGGARVPADRCSRGDCPEVQVIDSRFTGGEVQVDLPGPVLFSAEGSIFEGAKTTISARGARLNLDGCTIAGVSQTGTALRLRSVSGRLSRCAIQLWDTGLEIGDGGCPDYSDLLVGGSLALANDISNTRTCLRLLQPEPILAEANFWGSTQCQAVLAAIQGQTVETITDAQHAALTFCSTAAERSTWGGIKSRYAPTAGGSRP